MLGQQGCFHYVGSMSFNIYGHEPEGVREIHKAQHNWEERLSGIYRARKPQHFF